MKILDSPLKEDLEHILNLTPSLWEDLRDKRIFVTGGTGLFGRWMLESFLWANINLGLNAQMVVLSRNPAAFLTLNPHLNHPSIQFKAGRVTDFYFDYGHFDFLIHMAATSAEETFNKADLLEKYDMMVNGTRRVLDFATVSGVKKMLFTSSGVVYGKQPADIAFVPETYIGAPEPSDTSTLSSWGQSKRSAEHLCALYHQKYGTQTKIARCFSFVGPGLPLDLHYAIGNFIKDAKAGGPINILGDGTAVRGYLYMSDLAVWLWTILFKGEPNRAYNVGSEEVINMTSLAHLIAGEFDSKIRVTKAQTYNHEIPTNRYVPCTQRAREELGLHQTIDLLEALKRTIQYYS